MTPTNWLDLGFLTLLAVFTAAFIWDVWKRRHRHCEITVRRGIFDIITVSGASAKDAIAAIEEIRAAAPENEETK